MANVRYRGRDTKPEHLEAKYGGMELSEMQRLKRLAQTAPDSARPGREAANLGVARPPLVYSSSIALGVILHFVWPLSILPSGLTPGLGATVVLLAIGCFCSPFAPSEQLVHLSLAIGPRRQSCARDLIASAATQSIWLSPFSSSESRCG